MAENAEKNPSKKGPGFVARVSRFFRDLSGEVKKVVWPNKKQVINNTFVVIVVVVTSAIVVGAFDLLLGVLRTLLLSA